MQPKQGVGPSSGRGYVNGADLDSDNYGAPVAGSGLRVGGVSNSGLRLGGSAIAAWNGEVDARIKDGARTWANWDSACGGYTAKQDAEAQARYRAWLPQQHRQADAYRRELALRDQQWIAQDDAIMARRSAEALTTAANSAPTWNMRDASAALRGRAHESSFSHGFNLGSRSVLDGVEVTTAERVGRPRAGMGVEHAHAKGRPWAALR